MENNNLVTLTAACCTLCGAIVGLAQQDGPPGLGSFDNLEAHKRWHIKLDAALLHLGGTLARGEQP